MKIEDCKIGMSVAFPFLLSIIQFINKQRGENRCYLSMKHY